MNRTLVVCAALVAFVVTALYSEKPHRPAPVHYGAKGLLAPAHVDDRSHYRERAAPSSCAWTRPASARARANEQRRLVTVPAMDHSFSTHPNLEAAFENMGAGDYPAAAAAEIVRFIRSTLSGPPSGSR